MIKPEAIRMAKAQAGKMSAYSDARGHGHTRKKHVSLHCLCNIQGKAKQANKMTVQGWRDWFWSCGKAPQFVWVAPGLLAGASLSAQSWPEVRQHPTSPWPGLDAGAVWGGVPSPSAASTPWCPPQTSVPAVSSATLHPSDTASYIWRGAKS